MIIKTVFDHNSAQGVLYTQSIRNALLRVLPSSFFLAEEISKEEFLSLLPLIKYQQQAHYLSITLLCPYRINGMKFFYDMVSRWLLPGKRLNITSFFATDFTIAELGHEKWTTCEIVIPLEHSHDQELIQQQMPIFEAEIKLGLASVYHANRILEIKGLSADEKTALIQERVVSLLKRRPKDFDHGIFAQMQHFLVMCSDEFKTCRAANHMCRLIYVFYLFQKSLKKQIERAPVSRFVLVKLCKTSLQTPFGLKKVLSVFAALNFLNENELFEQNHLMEALKNCFSNIKFVKDSFFARMNKEEKTQLLYLEVEKEHAEDISLAEVQQIRAILPDKIRSGIEKLERTVFMPRNEEEVMRGIVTLADQLHYSNDLPQVMIHFEQQIQSELSFTVIWLRVRKEMDVSLQQKMEAAQSFLTFTHDRVKIVGLLRKKYPKEATVFRVHFSADPFLRADHCVDLLKARQGLAFELQRILGEYRDYNGGMIAKQYEQFLALKQLVEPADTTQELLLENFFHAIFPIELRTISHPLFLKKLFLMFLQAVQQNLPFQHVFNQEGCYILFAFEDPSLREKMVYRGPCSELLLFSTEYLDHFYQGFIYKDTDHSNQEAFLKEIFSLWESLTFEMQTTHTS